MRVLRQKKDSIHSQSLLHAEFNRMVQTLLSLLLAKRKTNCLPELSSDTEVVSSLSPNMFKRKPGAPWKDSGVRERIHNSLMPSKSETVPSGSFSPQAGVMESTTIATFIHCLNNILPAVSVKILSSIQ